MKISVFGAGAWGTALAIHAARRHPVVLWARDAQQVQTMAQARRNDRYLEAVGFPSGLQVSADWDAAVAHAASGDGLAVIATPMSALRATLARLPARLPALWLCKGFEAGTGGLGHEIAREVRPGSPCAVLSGPSFAIEVARQQPTAVVVASDDAALVQQATTAFHDQALRVYASSDPVGVEVGGAVKNVLAIATGVADGLAAQLDPAQAAGVPGLNARAALVTRGLAEMTRLGLALGAKPETFMGLSGLGDLVLTATGALSRNRQVGLKLAQGLTLAQAVDSLGHVAEGVYTAATAWRRAQALGVDMPITQAVVQVLEGHLTPRQCVSALMARESRSEY